MRAFPAGGSLTTLAGTGEAGFNGEIVTPVKAQLKRPLGVAADARGNWYVADTGNNRVRKVQPGGNLFTIAGNGNASYFGDGGLGTKASVNQPEGVAVDARGNVYIADTLDHAIRKVAPDGIITTLAGTGQPGYSGDGGPATQARLAHPRRGRGCGGQRLRGRYRQQPDPPYRCRRLYSHRGYGRLADRTARSGRGSTRATSLSPTPAIAWCAGSRPERW